MCRDLGSVVRINCGGREQAGLSRGSSCWALTGPQGALKLDGSLGLLPELRGQAFVSLHGPVTTLGKVAPSQGQFLERLAAEICQPTYYHPSGWGIVPEAWRGTRQHTSICNNDPGAAAVLFNLESSTFRTPVGVLSAGNF